MSIISQLNKFTKILPSELRQKLKRGVYRLLAPNLLPALDGYIYTDEQTKYVHILEAINYLRVAGDNGNRLPQTYFEFGCHSGRTFSAAIRAAKYLNLNNAEFYAFDSFSGLPATNEADDGIFKSGEFATTREEFVKIVYKKTGLLLTKKNIIEGYYNQTLNNELITLMPKIGVVHIDVDLYSSTVDVLNFIKPLIVKGTLIMFDDWYCFPVGSNMGERRALEEFISSNSQFVLEPWKNYSTFGKSFFVADVPSDNIRIC